MLLVAFGVGGFVEREKGRDVAAVRVVALAFRIDVEPALRFPVLVALGSVRLLLFPVELRSFFWKGKLNRCLVPMLFGSRVGGFHDFLLSVRGFAFNCDG